MMAYYVGPLRRGARQNLDKYYDRAFDVFDSYYEVSEGWMPESWREKLGESKDMDWGSWLYVCDRKLFETLMGDYSNEVTPITPAKEGEAYATVYPRVSWKEIPRRKWYGILQAELY